MSLFCTGVFSIMWSSWLNTREHYSKHELTGAILTLFATAFAAILLRRWWKAKNSSVASPPLPPGPRGLPLVGYLPFLGTDLQHEFSKLAGVYGPIFKLWLGNKLCIVISSPLLVKEVVRDHDAIFANHDTSASAFVTTYGGNDIFTLWSTMEEVAQGNIFVREMLSKTVLDNLYSLRREEVHKSIKQIHDKINTPIDIGNLAFLTAINATTSMLCGASSRPGDDAVDAGELRKAAMEMMVLLGKPNISDLFPSLAWLDLQGILRETKKVISVFERLFDSAIQRVRDRGERNGIEDKHKDFFQFLLELLDEQGSDDESTAITMAQLKAMLMDILLGGTDTLTATVEWIMTGLLMHPESMRKVHEELTQVVGLNNMVEEFHLSQLKYLNAVIKETFRLHPPLPLLVPRFPNQTSTIGGYKVPKNARIFLNIRAIQRDPEFWEDPLEFRPERFMNPEASKYDLSGNNFHFLPFGSGRRVCAGLPLAERMLGYMVASFLHSFDWKLPPDTRLELSDKFGIVVKKQKTLIAIPTSRLCTPEFY